MFILKTLTHLCFTKKKKKNKKWFGKSCLQCFSSEKIRIKHREDCLSINGVQSVKVEEGIIKLKIILSNYRLHLKFMPISSVI